MSLFGVNYELNNLGLSGLQIFYDFDSFSAGGACINSVESGNTLYSGEIVNSDVHFTGSNSGSGYFRDQHIEIQNTTGITSENCTILFSQEKTGVGAGTIFSSFEAPSGFELGINDANKFYYKNIISGSLNYVTLESYPSDKNLYAFTMSSNGGGALYRLNFRTPQPTPFPLTFTNTDNVSDGNQSAPKYYNFNSKRFTVEDYSVSVGPTWKIGSGEFQYEGYMDYFLYFDVNIGTDGVRKIARSMHAEASLVPAVTGEVSGTITGYDITSTGISGVISTAFNVSGTGTPSGNYFFPSGSPLTGTVGISGEVFIPLKEISGIVGSNLPSQTVYKRIRNLSFTHTMTGGMSVGTLDDYYYSGSYWLFSGNSGQFKGVDGEGPAGNIFGITGFEIITQSGSRVGIGVPVVEATGVSGSMYDQSSFSGVREDNIPFTGTGAYVNFGEDADPSYYAGALSLMGPPDPEFVYELLYDISGQQNLNTFGTNNSNPTYAKYTTLLTGALNLSGINFTINGVTDMTGKVEFGKNDINFPIYTINSGFDIQTAEVFTHLTLDENDVAIFDNIPIRSRENLRITDVAEYAGAPFAEITETDNQIFFNGVKLISGIDYTFAGGFNPQGAITQATGLYFTVPQYSGDPVLQYASGFLTEPITVYSPDITPYGYVLYFNGIRQPVTNIIEHAAKSDLITGTDVNPVSRIIYSMERGATIYNGV